jgi:hypothetical protein
MPFDKVSGPASISYVPSYGTDSGSLHNFKIVLKIKFLSPIFLLKLDGNRLILTWCSFICSPTLIPFKTNVSNPYLRPFYPWNRNLDKDHDSGSDSGKMIWLRRFRFRVRLRLRNTAGSLTKVSPILKCLMSVVKYFSRVLIYYLHYLFLWILIIVTFFSIGEQKCRE